MIRTHELLNRLYEIENQIELEEAVSASSARRGGNASACHDRLRDAIRKELLRHPPTQVVTLFFAARWESRITKALRDLKKEFGTRRSVIQWIYGKSFATEFNYSRIASRSKRLFVFDLVSRVRKRYPWISSALVHAFAFRPSQFEMDHRSRAKKGWRWKGLYEARTIAKGGKSKRVLHVPSPPLKRLQRCILQLCLERATATLPPNVNGCRPRLSPNDPTFGVYRNAAAHIGQAFVVNFDVRDFFPSVRVDDVIRTLLRLNTPLHVHQSNANTLQRNFPSQTNDASGGISFSEFLTDSQNPLPSKPLEHPLSGDELLTQSEPWLRFFGSMSSEGQESEQYGSESSSFNQLFAQFSKSAKQQQFESTLPPEALAWTHDAAVLIARLCTYRGRLPQGAPTSPALANLAFAEYDVRIQQSLGPDFVYTRYVDDLTISLSHAAARRNKFSAKDEMRAHVEAIVREAIAKSSFQLNPRKTRVSELAEGHRITGLRVDKHSVRLPRESLRRLRSLVYRIEKSGFVEVATSFIGGEVHASTLWDPAALQHRRTGRRLSTERLAALMVRELCPNLKIEVPSQKWTLGGSRIDSPPELHEGKQACRDLERLLPRLWENELLAEFDEGHVEVRDRAGLLIGRLRTERNIEFLLLAKRDAIACVEFWHWLRGWESSLNPKSNDRCFAHIVAAQAKLRRIREGLRIKVPDSGELVSAAKSGSIAVFSLSKEGGPVVDLSNSVSAFYRQFRRDLMKAPPSNDVTRSMHEFGVPVNTAKQFKDWINASRIMFLDSISRLPTTGRTDEKGFDVFTLLRILDDCAKGKREHGYDIAFRFLKKNNHKIESLADITDAETPLLQKALLDLLKDRFQECDAERRAQGTTTWQETQQMNPWFPSSESALRDSLLTAADRFIDLRGKGIWRTTGEPVFRKAGNEELIANVPRLSELIDSATSGEVWRQLFEFGKVISAATSDCLAGDPMKTLSPEVVSRLNRQPNRKGEAPSAKDLFEEFHLEVGGAKEYFEILYKMRNRASHPEDPSQRGDWIGIQKHVAKLLARRFKGPKPQSSSAETLYGPDDLKLTHLEGNEVKLRMLQGVCHGLQQLQHPAAC